MVKGLGVYMAAAVLAASASLGLSAQQGAVRNGPAAPIRLKAATFTPASGEQPPIPPGLTIAGYGATQRGYYLVQFSGPVLDAWKASVAAAGAELLDCVPEFAFKARMTPDEAAQVARLDSVVWVGLFHPAYKLVHDPAHAVVSGAVVTGTWSGGSSGSTSCTTSAAGVCTVTTGTLNRQRTSVTFTVGTVNASGFTYTASSNHDPDGDTNGSTITVLKP